RPDPSSPSAVGAASFPVSRRGYDQGEVRDFLRMVAAELARLQERERFLESELRAMQTRGMSGPGRLDEETVTTLLGEEAARVLSTARDASTQIRERAEESATRLVKDAADDATRIRESAMLEAQRIHDDAQSDANAEVEMAKQQGRDMVNEAREYREKVLSELSRRRDAARAQIEQLLHGRDRLMNAFERARIASESVLNELHDAHDEPETLVNLAPTTGPIPIVNPHHPSVTAYDQEVQTEVAAAVQHAEEIVRTGSTVIDMSLEEIFEPTAEELATVDEEEAVDVVETEVIEDVDVVEIVEVAEEETVDTPEAEVIEPEEEPTATNVVSLFGRRNSPVPEIAPEVKEAESAPVAPVVDHPVNDKPKKDAKADHSVDDIFAKLRAGSTQTVATATTEKADKPKPAEPKATKAKKADKPAPAKAKAPKAIEAVVDPARFAARNEAIAPTVPNVARKFKRVLADEQNNVLEHLRGKRSSLEMDAIIGTIEEQAQRYAAAIAEDSMAAAGAGAKSMKDARGTSKRVTQKVVNAAVVKAIADGLVAMFREDTRIAIGEAEGDRGILASLMRDVYRKWKMTGIDEHVDDVVCAAFNIGAFVSLEPTADIVWMVDSDSPCCGDCADNSLAGSVTKGKEFPTGHAHPMAHAGCRCLIGPATH
ncbi:MAG: hypothetical protein RLZZ544_266, partial [Actinomycetota bacterium]